MTSTILTRSRKEAVTTSKQLVLLLACKHGAMGPSGTNLPRRATTDEIRVRGLKKLLAGEARVLTVNINLDASCDYHFNADISTPRFVSRLREYVNVKFGADTEVTDVYLDYYGLQKG